ncbi:MAG: bacteriophage Gp15 family protein [Clostridia bacterium]|nr:bacteriophage Gp15 family protein [Clostridia bacterium]
MGTPLIFGLPDAVEIGGVIHPIRTDFRIGIKFEQLFTENEGLDESEQMTVLVKALRLWYPKPPRNIPEAIDKMLWFYGCGDKKTDAQGETSGARLYDLKHDEAYLHAAFLTQYDIDLYRDNLHWWTFCSLFKALDDCRLTQIIGYRGIKIDPKHMTKAEQEFYTKMKKRYALPLPEADQQRIDELEAALMSGKGIDEALAKQKR